MQTTRTITRRLLLATAATVVAGSAFAQQAWPAKPITLIVPFPAGGPTDVVSRIVGKELADRLKQPVIVENRAGASGSIAAMQVKRAAPVGYTLMTLATPTLFAPLFYKGAGYDVVKDFTPISMIYDLPIVMVVNPTKLPGVNTLPKLIETAAKGQQLPFRYFSAFTAVGASAPSVVKDALETCLEESLGNLPMFSGRVMSLCDNSGSAQGAMTSSMGSVQVNHIANLTAVLTARRSEDGHVGVFGDKLQTFSVGKKSSVFTEVEKANTMGQGIGQSTEHGVWLFWDKAIKNKEHWDHVFVYSDMQAGHGGLYGTGGYDAYRWQNGRHIDVPKLIAEYRRTVNPNVHVYLVQVAGYRDTLVPEVYAKTHILGGWGDGILRYAARMAELEGGAVQTAPVLQIAPPAAVVASPIVATKKRVRKST